MSVIIASGVTNTSLPRIGWRALSGDIVASSAAAGFAASRAAAEETYDGWRPTTLPARWSVELPGSTVADYMGIAAHDLDGYTIRPQRWSGSAWVDIAPAVVVDGSTAIFWLFAPVASERFALFISAGPALPTIGHIRFGEVLMVPRLASYVGDPIDEGQQITLRTNRSETGEFLGSIVEGNGLQFSVQIDHLAEPFRQGAWRSFRNHAERARPFFIAPKPGPYPREVAYAWLSGRAAVSRQIPNRHISGNVTIDCVGYSRP